MARRAVPEIAYKIPSGLSFFMVSTGYVSHFDANFEIIKNMVFVSFYSNQCLFKIESSKQEYWNSKNRNKDYALKSRFSMNFMNGYKFWEMRGIYYFPILLTC